MGIKRTTADIAFSKAVRESFDWECQVCHSYGKHNPAMMDCSHIISRANRRTRFTVDNAICLCRSCHEKMGRNTLEHAALAQDVLGEDRYWALKRKANTVKKIPKTVEKQIAKHYRNELKRIEDLRNCGHRGIIKLEDWEVSEDFTD